MPATLVTNKSEVEIEEEVNGVAFLLSIGDEVREVGPAGSKVLLRWLSCDCGARHIVGCDEAIRRSSGRVTGWLDVHTHFFPPMTDEQAEELART
jgi:hypothetical protein